MFENEKAYKAYIDGMDQYIENLKEPERRREKVWLSQGYLIAMELRRRTYVTEAVYGKLYYDV